MRIGIHTSTAGGLENAANEAVALAANTFQIFSSSPRTWRYPPLRPANIRALRQRREQHDLTPLVIHNNYLINLAAADAAIRERSTQAYRQEVVRALEIGAEYLVAHPGSAKHQPREAAIENFGRSLATALAGLKPGRLTLLLENTAGQGDALGSRFEELAALAELAAAVSDFPIGFCIDTCHCLAAGYDVASEAGLSETIAALDELLGLDRVQVIHANDSRGGLGSRVDRHAHIGQGAIGEEGFRRILRHSAFRDKPFILETPVESEGDPQRNLDALRRLALVAADG